MNISYEQLVISPSGYTSPGAGCIKLFNCDFVVKS